VSIDLIVSNAVNSIKLHALDLEISSVSISGGSSPLNASSWSADGDGVLTVLFPSQIAAGKASISLSFAGKLLDTMCGYYRSRTVVDGKDAWVAVTQFEPTGTLCCHGLKFQMRAERSLASTSQRSNRPFRSP
jgi:aminopeptidase N